MSATTQTPEPIRLPGRNGSTNDDGFNPIPFTYTEPNACPKCGDDVSYLLERESFNAKALTATVVTCDADHCSYFERRRDNINNNDEDEQDDETDDEQAPE